MEHIKTFTRETAGRMPSLITADCLTGSAMVNPPYFLAAEWIGMIEKDLECAREDTRYSQSPKSVGA